MAPKDCVMLAVRTVSTFSSRWRLGSWRRRELSHSVCFENLDVHLRSVILDSRSVCTQFRSWGVRNTCLQITAGAVLSVVVHSTGQSYTLQQMMGYLTQPKTTQLQEALGSPYGSGC